MVDTVVGTNTAAATLADPMQHLQALAMVATPPTSIRRVTESCGVSCVETVTAEALHEDCFCVAVDPAAVREHLNTLLAAGGTSFRLGDAHAHLFSSLPIFVPEHTIAQMTAAVRALTAVVCTPAYSTAVMAWAPPIAALDPGSPGGLMGFDFHLGPDGPRLIEINTNPGGLLLNATLAQAQRLCLPDLSVPAAAPGVEVAAIATLLDEWRLQRGQDPAALVAIVDEVPEQQYLYAEFLLFKRGLEAQGQRAAICDPHDLRYVDGALRLGDARVGFVYNRLTDFALDGLALEPLRQAYLAGAIALSPHPRAHALWADKRNLSLLCQPEFLARTGLPSDQQALLARVVPPTVLVTADNREQLWTTRRQWFFKPAAGFGSRASYRGDKLTRKTWEQMAAMAYVAQAIVAPSERHTAPAVPPLKVDLRCYAYQGQALLFAARLYQGQTTNFRTAGGGFAPVLTLLDTN
jgi:hypothetical protein